MKKYEYKILTIDSSQFNDDWFQKDLNAKFEIWGEEGWDLIKMEPYTAKGVFQSNSTQFFAIFKREKLEY